MRLGQNSVRRQIFVFAGGWAGSQGGGGPVGAGTTWGALQCATTLPANPLIFVAAFLAAPLNLNKIFLILGISTGIQVASATPGLCPKKHEQDEMVPRAPAPLEPSSYMSSSELSTSFFGGATSQPGLPEATAVDHQKLQDRMGSIVRSKEGKMVNVSARTPFTLQSAPAGAGALSQEASSDTDSATSSAHAPARTASVSRRPPHLQRVRQPAVRELCPASKRPEREEHEHAHGDDAQRGDDPDTRVLPCLARARPRRRVLRVPAVPAPARRGVRVRDRVERERAHRNLRRDGVARARVERRVARLERTAI
ncbi:hypothetical protein C8R47DRAFT_1084732 [Mycena vitilis]|nr:hypothetical protein C8R47DRAFT_1084732 [Mycena vitilis]